MDVCAFMAAVLAQQPEAIRPFFHRDAYINWHCTNEHFTVDEYITANCEYPGQWDGQVERVEALGQLLVAVTHVYTRDKRLSFHVTSFIRLEDERIATLDEYWAEDTPAPQWRQSLHLGCGIHPAGQ